MSAYRICPECGAALDPGERCDCRPAVPLKLIQPEAGQISAPRHKRLMNTDFTGRWAAPSRLRRNPKEGEKIMLRLKANKTSLYKLVSDYEKLPPMRRTRFTKAPRQPD